MSSRQPSKPVLRSTALGIGLAVCFFTSNHSVLAQEFGSIKGRVVWGGAGLTEKTARLKKGDRSAKDFAICAAEEIPDEDLVVDSKTRGVANVFAYVLKPVGQNPKTQDTLLNASPEIAIDLKGCRFSPHAVALHKGQRLVFTPDNRVGHNVNSGLFRPGCTSLLPAPDGKLSMTFASGEPHPGRLQCDIHPWMSGVVMVFDHPFFTLTKPDGSFEIQGIPAGSQRVIVRHETTGYLTANGNSGLLVEVKPGASADLGEIRLTPKGGSN